MVKEIVKCIDTKSNGIYSRTIVGLNIFRRNNDVGSTKDPIRMFVKSLSESINCSLHVDLDIWMQSPEEFFPTVNISSICWNTHVGIYKRFYFNNENICCFFSSDVQQIIDEYYDELFNYESTAIYVGATEYAIQGIRHYLETPPVDDRQLALKPNGWKDERFHMAWLAIATSFYPLIIVNGHDGDYFTVYTNNSQNYHMLSDAITTAINVIIDSNWYKEYREELEWNDEVRCLVKNNNN